MNSGKQKTIVGAKEALLYRTLEGDVTECYLCAHRCRIQPGRQGLCLVRHNRQGTLYTLVYGKLIAKHIDPIEKKPLFHFLPGSLSFSIATVGCNFRCDFCQNWQISQVSSDDVPTIPGEYESAERIVDEALASGCKSIAYTYTEPTIFFEYALEVARLAHRVALKNIFVTNGYQTPETIEKMAGLIDAANVDLKSFSDAFYRKLCKARLHPVLEAIKTMHDAGIFLEVTTLIVPDQNDSSEELEKIAAFISSISQDIPWHVSRFHPDYEMRNSRITPQETIFRAVEIGERAGLRYVYAGNLPAGEYEKTHCPTCGKTVLSRVGFMISGMNLDVDRCRFCGQKLPLVMG